MSRTALCLLFLLVPAAAQAQPSDLSGFAFLRLEPSARAAALGGSYAAMYGDDINAAFYNPALVNEEMDRRLSVSYLNHLSDLNAGFVAYGHHWEGLATFSAGLRFLSWGSLERANEQGERDGTFSAGDVAFTVGAARALNEHVRYGVNLHAIYSGVESYSASALAADLGVLYVLPGPQFTLSASVNNLGVTLNSLGSTHDDLPIDLRIGLTKRLRHLPLLLSVMGYNLHDLGGAPDDATALDNVLSHFSFGGEFQFSEAFNIRFGYNHQRHENLKMKSRLDFAGFGFGAGINLSRVRVDYAFNSWSSLGGLHQFTVGTRL
jgi:long-subunit fatty acid transport protein